MNDLWLIIIYYAAFLLVLIAVPLGGEGRISCHVWNPLPHLAYWLAMGPMALWEAGE
ncbi:MAG: hypothetical protein WC683_11860 [bacterium]